MGLLQTLGFRRPKGTIQPIREATTGDPDWTPSPITDDWATNPRENLHSWFNREQQDPERIEWMYLHCDEWADVAQKLVSETWQRGLEVVPVHDLLCETCGEAVDDPEQGCPFCGDRDDFRPPDPEGRLILEEFLANANPRERHDLTDEGRRKTEEMLKHGIGYIVTKYAYTIEDDTGLIQEAKPVGVKAASSARMVRLRRTDDRPGGTWICIDCRGTRTKYAAQDKPGPCKHCHRPITYEAYYAERTLINSEEYRTYYLSSEVDETSWPYSDGTPPIKRLERKVLFLIYADYFAQAAVDPQKPNRPDRILVTMGGDETKVAAWSKKDAEERKKNPHKGSHLHIPSPPGGLQDLKMSAQILDWGDQHIRGHLPEVRDSFTRRIRAHYGVSSLKGGDTESGGGLNNEGLQLRSESEVAQTIQAREKAWPERLAKRLGVHEWTYRFRPPMQEDEGRELDQTGKGLDVAAKAAQSGLKVKWVNGKPRISDGDVTAPMAGLLGPGGGPAVPSATPPTPTPGLDANHPLPPDQLLQAEPGWRRLGPDEPSPPGKEVRRGPRGGRWVRVGPTKPGEDSDGKPSTKKESPISDEDREWLKKQGVSKFPSPDAAPDDIRINRDADPDRQALITWRDSKNRIQHGYSKEFHRLHAEKKWARIKENRPHIEEVRTASKERLRTAKPGSPEHEKALLTATMSRNGLRPGNDVSAKHGHFGMTTLKPEHVTVEGDTVHFKFVGKSGKQNTSSIEDPIIAKGWKDTLDVAESEERDTLFTVRSGDLKDELPGDMKVKDLRTIVATELAERELRESDPPPPLPEKPAEAKRLLEKRIKDVSSVVSSRLNNTPAVARASYIHPVVISSWLDRIGGSGFV